MKRMSFALAATAMMAACSRADGISAVDTPRPSATGFAQTSISTPASTHTPLLPTAIPPSPTPVSPVITLDTVASLSTFMSFAEGELVRSLAFSPDGTALAAAVGDEARTVRLHQVASGLPLRTLEGHKSIVWGLAFSPDGRLLASASRDHTAKVWDWRTESLLRSLDFPNRTIEGYIDEVVSVAFSPDSQTLAVGGVDQWLNAVIWTYAVDSWKSLMNLAEFWNIPDIAFSPDGAMLVGGGTSRNVRVWRVNDGAEQFSLYHAGQVSSIAISPDGSTAATGLCEASTETGQCTRGAVWLWNLDTGTLIQKLSDFPEGVEGVAFSLDGSLVIAGSRDGTVRAYATSDYQPLLVTTSPLGPSPAVILALALSPDGRFVATGGVGKVNLWRVEP